MSDSPSSVAPSEATKRAIARVAKRGGGKAGSARAGDRVFRALARRILRGELAPMSAIPSERELAEKFSVSKMSVRQAIYQLEELELVRVRQGRSTVALDPDEAVDPRVMALSVELASQGDRDTRDLAERVILHVAGALKLAERRIKPAELDALDELLDAYEARGLLESEFVDLETAFYSGIAKATRNRIFIRETTWWFRFLRKRALDMESHKSPHGARFMLCREIARRLRAKEDAAAFYEQFALGAIAAMLPPLDEG